MTAIDWALYSEQAVGKGAPALADVINRPLREVLTLSGVNPDGAFPGFVVQGGSFVGALTGNASTATALSSTRTFAITGDVAGNASADLSGGVSIAVALQANAVSNANVAASAAIAYSKLALGGSILNADIAAGANIADSKLAPLTTANKVANSATTATAANAVSTIVLRDGAGAFSAGAISATSFAGDGSALTSLAAGAIATGTLAGARLTGSYTGITGLGTIAVGVWNATVIGPTFGGTGLIAAAIGDLLYASAANTWARLAGNALTTRKFLVQSGDNTNPAAPSWGLPSAAEVAAGTFAGAFMFAGAVTLQTTLTTTLGTLSAGSVPAASSAATWNNASTTFVHQFVNVTDTTSAAASLLAQWQVNSADVFKVTKTGAITATSLTVVAGTGSPAAGTVSLTPTAGLVLRAASGSGADFLLQTGAGVNIALVLPGTTSWVFLGNVGFNATAAIAKPTVTGSRGANAALASLLTALAAYGLVVDSST